LRFIQIIRPRRDVPQVRIDPDLVAAVDDILHYAPRREHASWYRTWLAIRRLPEVGRSVR